MARYLVCFDCARELVSRGADLVSAPKDERIEIPLGKLCDVHGNTQAVRAVEFHGDLPKREDEQEAESLRRVRAQQDAQERRELARRPRRATMRVPLGPETEIATRVLCALIPDGTVLDDPELVRRAVRVSRMLLAETENG